MKKRLRIIIGSFCVSFLLVAALCLFSLERLDTFMKYSDQVDHTNMVIGKVFRLEGILKDIDRAERGYILTRDTMYVRFLDSAIDSIGPTVTAIRDFTKDNPEQQKNLVLLRSDLWIRITSARQDVAYVDSTHSNIPSAYYYDGRKKMTECSQMLRNIHTSENRLLQERFRNEEVYQELTSSGIRYLLFIFCLITIGLFVLMINELRKRIRYQDELHARIVDLKRSHNELEQIAYAASHDLQEPLRKIQVFGNRLLYVKGKDADQETKGTMERINTAASRMQELIDDLVSLTSLTSSENNKQTADLNFIVKFAINELEDKLAAADVTMDVKPLPKIKGYPEQLQILFKALIDNAAKFTRDGVKPIIVISNEVTNGHEIASGEILSGRRFNCITVSDNGIGFDNKFSDKMFQIFQRLHNQHSEYDGKGIGLAICQRVMANHEGYIKANGEPGLGATFKLFFPIED